MNLISAGVRKGRPAGVKAWAGTARSGESIGMTPEQYYLLRLTLRVKSPQQYDRHPDNRRYRGSDGWTQTPLDVAEWRTWVELVNSGVTPLRATGFVLSGGEEHGF